MSHQKDRLSDDIIELGLARRAPHGPDSALLESIIVEAARTPQVRSWETRIISRAPSVQLAWIAVVMAVLLTIVALVVGGSADRRPDPAVVVTPPPSTRPTEPTTAPPPLDAGEAIAFWLSEDPSNIVGDVHLMNADGTADRVIGAGSCPKLSKTGSVLAYRTGMRRTAQVTVAAPDGASPRIVPGIGGSEYALSPDGTRIVWLKALPMIETNLADGTTLGYGQAELWVTPVRDGPGARVVPASADLDESFQSFAWSPDGRRIAFGTSKLIINGGNVGSYRSAIYVVDADGSHLRRLTARPGTDQIGFSWSPDGQQIAYVGLPDGSPLPSLGAGSGARPDFSLPQDVFVINADGTDDRNLTRTETDEADPEWSPDGSHLSYTFTDGGGHRLTTVRIGRGADTSQPNFGPTVDFVAWSPTGAELLLVTTGGRYSSPRVDHKAWSRLSTVDADLQRDPVTLLESDEAVGCPPSWESLAP